MDDDIVAASAALGRDLAEIDALMGTPVEGPADEAQTYRVTFIARALALGATGDGTQPQRRDAVDPHAPRTEDGPRA